MGEDEIDALAAPAWEQAVLRAARYGMLVGDTGSDYLGWSIFVQSGSSYTSFGLPDPWVRLAQRYGVPASDRSGLGKRSSTSTSRTRSTGAAGCGSPIRA
jgi:hypothetical protein